MADNRHLEVIQRLLTAETYFRSRQKEVEEHEPERPTQEVSVPHAWYQKSAEAGDAGGIDHGCR